MRGYEHANSTALDLWEEVYPNGLTLLALTDTFSTKAFFQVRARSFPSSHQSAPLKFPPLTTLIR
jgi:nicotinic acid phosphoribosyltransferase